MNNPFLLQSFLCNIRIVLEVMIKQYDEVHLHKDVYLLGRCLCLPADSHTSLVQYRLLYKCVTARNYNMVTVYLFLTVLFFEVFFFFKTVFPSIVNVLYSIWQDGCWWDTEINKGDFVGYQSPAGRPVSLSSSNGLIMENSNPWEHHHPPCVRLAVKHTCSLNQDVWFKEGFFPPPC